MKKKINKKKVILSLFLVFAFVGVVGYGVYSYYFAEGSVTSRSEQISFRRFNVEVNGDGQTPDFISNVGDIPMTCTMIENTGTSPISYECSTHVTVHNEGENSVLVTLNNVEVAAVEDASGLTTISSISTSWDSDTETISGNSQSELEVTATVTLPPEYNGYSMSSSLAYPINYPVYGGYFIIGADFDISAEEIMN